MIPYGRQSIDESDIEAVVAVLRSAWVTQGPAIAAFEQGVADYCGAPHAVAVCNATAALHLACLALDVGPGDLVWTTPNTFVASANCARYCGADVDFVDIDPATLNMSTAALAEKLAAAARQNRLPKVLIPVHFSGQSCDMAEIANLAREYGFRVIEDASHAVGASYQGEPVGNGRFSDITIFSFHPVKIITTGEGGMALTRDPLLAARLARLRSHGITREPTEMENETEGPWYYEQIELGFNARMTDLQAALGLSQLKRLESFIARRELIAERYSRLLAGKPVVCPSTSANRRSAWHLYPVRVAADKRRAVFEALRVADIGVQAHYIPVHLQPYYRRLGFKPGDFPAAEQYYREAISLPMFPGLTDTEQEHVVAVLSEALR